MKTKKALSLVEIIITISIIALLAVVWMSYQWASNQKAKNTRTIWDIGTINNSILSYLEEKNELPEPKWNKNYFGTGSEYAHDENDSFWVHWFVTQNLLPKKYLNYLPLDPRTNQYYAYWKTNNNKFYEIAWVLNIDWDYQSKVEWNYPWENWPYSLIREYNWPNFVSDGSKYSFPYNPTERVLVAQIDSFSGSITISSDNYVINNSEQIFNHTLVSWDKITVPAGGSAIIFYSDWSQSVLWDTSKESVLTALKNICKHSKADTVRILMRKTPNQIYYMIIEDDGIGFDKPPERTHEGEHIGLSVMRERAEMMGGELEIESEPGEGTQILLSFTTQWEI